MLNAEETAGAVVAGFVVELHGKTFDDVRAMAARATAAGAEMFVAGDTCEERFMESGVIGVAIARADVDGTPVEIARARIDEALAKTAGLADALGIEGLGEHGVYLLSWGPLPAATLSVGVRRDAHEEDGFYGPPPHTKLKFFEMSDMTQAWGPEGVDGVHIASVEFGDAERVDLSEDALAPLRAEAGAKVEDPRIFLTARYD
jgi:hypothetical protein